MKTILIVDDETAMLDILQSVLEDEGYRVVTARNGREGLDCMAQMQPDIVLCDVMMPVLDGRDMCLGIQNDPRYRDTPVLLMSAAPASPKLRDCRYAGFIHKPFDIEYLMAVVSEVLSGKVQQSGNND